MTDPIGDMLTRIRNAQRAHNKTVDIPWSSLKSRILDILLKEGYIENVSTADETAGARRMLRVSLKYVGKTPAIKELKRESKPGFRLYRHVTDIPTVVSGYGISIISTSRGIMTNKQARKQGVGGEVICSVY